MATVGQRDENQINNATITVAGQGSIIQNDSRSTWVLVVRTGAVTGTTPTLNFVIQMSFDGVNFFSLSAAANQPAAISTSTNVAFIFNNTSTLGPLPAPFLRVTWTTGGTTPVFNNVFADFVGLQ